MNLSDWFDLLLPEQREFFAANRGINLHALVQDHILQFEYDLDDGFWVYCDGAFIINEQDADWEAYAAEQEANGVQRVVLLDGRGDVLYETGANKVAPPEEWVDTPRDIKYHGLDILNVMLPYHLFRELEERLNGNIINENESKELCVLSLSASAIKNGEWNVGDGEEDNEEELVEQLEHLMSWLRWKVQMLPQVNEVRITVW